jgi:hypothetical protein
MPSRASTVSASDTDPMPVSGLLPTSGPSLGCGPYAAHEVRRYRPQAGDLRVAPRKEKCLHERAERERASSTAANPVPVGPIASGAYWGRLATALLELLYAPLRGVYRALLVVSLARVPHVRELHTIVAELCAARCACGIVPRPANLALVVSSALWFKPSPRLPLLQACRVS